MSQRHYLFHIKENFKRERERVEMRYLQRKEERAREKRKRTKGKKEARKSDRRKRAGEKESISIKHPNKIIKLIISIMSFSLKVQILILNIDFL